MNRKTRRFVTTLGTIFGLIFQSVAPAAVFAEDLIASESAEVAVTPTPEIAVPSPTLEATLEATPAAEITPTPTLEPEATPTATPMQVPTPTPVWTAADDGRAVTSSPVILGQRYQAPQNVGVSVTFSRLPESPGYLSIKEVNLTEEERAGIGAISTTAYEITSTMENGAFTYNLTLPYVDDNNDGVIGPDNTSIDSIGVAVSEDGSEYAPVEQAVTQKVQKLVEISDLDHFTIFVVVGTIVDNEEVDEYFDEGESPVLINEFGYRPSSGNEWIELYNRTEEEIDLSGWRLEDGNAINDDIDLSGVISAGGFLVFEHSNGWLNNNGDTINLKDDGASLISQVSYDSAGNVDGANDVGDVAVNQSVGRIRDAHETWDSFPSPTKGSSNQETLYVDADFDGDKYGTFNHPFTSIQDGAEEVLEGGTVKVAGGEYEENLNIERSLSLLGDPGDNGVGPAEGAPTIMASGCWVIDIDSNDVTVSGFVIEGDGCETPVIRVNSEVTRSTIADSEITGGGRGVNLRFGSSENSITNNLIHGNGTGISVTESWNNTISGNEIYENDEGLRLRNNGNCDEGECSLNGNTIEENNIHDNYGNGILGEDDITFEDLAISDNDITGNEGYGIYFNGITEGSLTISDNTITGSSSTGIYLSGGGASIVDSTVTISGNSISSNSGGGIYADVIKNTTFNISDNTNISGNSGYGIYICAEGECSNSTVTISGNEINENDGSGIYLYQILDGSTVTIEENDIQGNGEESENTGIYIDYVYNSTMRIAENDILENYGDGIHIVRIEAGSVEEEGETSVDISDNTVEENQGYGIYMSEVSNSDVTISENNTISGNTNTGIYLNEGVSGVSIVGNTIQNNGVESETTGIVVNNSGGNEAHNNTISGNNTGVANFDTEGTFDARENYWGAASGPQVTNTNPDGEGNGVEGIISYRPFYTDNTLQTLSTLNIDPAGLADLVNTGVFSLPEGESSDSVTQVTVEEELTLIIDEDGGESSVFLPVGTVISSSDGSTLDISDLTADDVSPGSLSGLSTGVTVNGALQWGIPDLGLEFSQPITLRIFVGVALNDQILNVSRSTSGSSGWTNDGIVAPATCTVVDGFCTFQATKASFYAATHTTSTGTTSSSSTSSDGGGGGGTTVCSDAKPASAPQLVRAATGSNTVTLTWSEAGNPVTYYLVAYGPASGTLTYGNPNIGGKGTTSYTVGSLSGGTTYYFRVRAGNGCAPGDYSNEIAATPGGGFIAGPAAGFAEGVLGVETENTSETTAPTPVLTPFLTPKPTSGMVLGREAGKWNWWWLLLIVPGPAALLWWWSRK